MRGMTNDLRWGLVLSLASFLWVCLEYALGLHTTRIELHPTLTNLFAPIPIVILTLAIRDHRSEDGELGWAEGLRSGMTVSAVTAALGAPTMWLFIRYVNPNYFSAMIAHAARHGHDDEATRSSFTLGGYAVQASVGPLVMGLITSLIVVAVLRFKARRQAVAVAA